MTLNNIYNMDCGIGISLLEQESIDLVVTSPPYNVDLGNNKYNKNPYDLYNDNQDHKAYIKWLKGIFELLYEKMKTGGRVCINIGSGKNGKVPTQSDVLQSMIELNYIPFSHIIWNKGETSNRAAWGSWLSPSSPSFPTPFEHVLIFTKRTRKLQHKGKTDLKKQEFIDWSLAMWNFPGETKQKSYGHPAMFPLELPIRCIKMLTYIGDVVCDPFAGLGTTLVAAKRLKRRYIGFEISQEYCNATKKRLEKIE